MTNTGIEIDGTSAVADVPPLAHVDLMKRIIALKKARNALVLAHYYQRPEIQEVADMVGDSLQMAEYAANSTASTLVIAGVSFMGETAKIVNPTRKVLIPDVSAGCSLADTCPENAFKEFIRKHPDAVVVTYINCSAEVKALSHIVCTSSNAVNVINSLPANRPIIFAPDANLGSYLIRTTGRNLILWNGSCVVHEAFSIDKILELHRQYPRSKFVAHPESTPEILKVASFVGSTRAMIDYVKNDKGKEFIIGTEAGILHKMSKEVPDKLLIPAPSFENNQCSCSECSFMKVNTLSKVYQCLLTEEPEVIVEEKTRAKAELALRRMLAVSAYKTI
ncbi:MAG: quinolinate synthase NadA [Imperialibacter sp.]|uniref:quinolinate synthase NadA n=1 Tax=Imperialibacter sp. TaxID=2038411 RepID=UPI0032F06DB8